MQQSASTDPRSDLPGKPHAHRITVEAREGPGGWSFTMREGAQAKQRLDYSKDGAGMRKHDWHEIDFILDDPSGQLAFHPDKWDAIWVARGSPHQEPPCPGEPSRDHEVYPIKVDDRELRVRNHNGERCLLSFRLNFVAAGSTSEAIIASLDPIMGNANGGSD